MPQAIPNGIKPTQQDLVLCIRACLMSFRLSWVFWDPLTVLDTFDLGTGQSDLQISLTLKLLGGIGNAD